AVEPEPGDRPGEPGAVGTVQAGHQAVVLVRAVPVHPGQPDPPPVRVNDVAATGGQRRLYWSGGHPGGRRARAAMCGGSGIPGGSTGSGSGSCQAAASGSTPAQTGRAASGESLSSGGPRRIFTDVSARPRASSEVFASSLLFGRRA